MKEKVTRLNYVGKSGYYQVIDFYVTFIGKHPSIMYNPDAL
jgi:hypothetical protein